MTDTDLATIDGVGEDSAASLEDAGFESVSDVAEATVEEISEAEGFGESRAGDTKDAAASLVEDNDGGGDKDDTVQDETDTVEEDEERNGPAYETAETYEVELLPTDKLHYHVIHVVLEEATRRHQSSEVSMRNRTYELAKKLMGAFPNDDNDTIELEKDELNSLYRALKQGSTDYSRRSGIPDMYAKFETLIDRVTEKRREAMKNE